MASSHGQWGLAFNGAMTQLVTQTPPPSPRRGHPPTHHAQPPSPFPPVRGAPPGFWEGFRQVLGTVAGGMGGHFRDFVQANFRFWEAYFVNLPAQFND